LIYLLKNTENGWNTPNVYVHVALYVQLQLYTAKSQYWLHKAGASPEHLQIKINKLLKKVLVVCWHLNNIKNKFRNWEDCLTLLHPLFTVCNYKIMQMFQILSWQVKRDQYSNKSNRAFWLAWFLRERIIQFRDVCENDFVGHSCFFTSDCAIFDGQKHWTEFSGFIASAFCFIWHC